MSAKARHLSDLRETLMHRRRHAATSGECAAYIAEMVAPKELEARRVAAELIAEGMQP